MNTIENIMNIVLNEKIMKLHGNLYHTTDIKAAHKVVDSNNFKMTHVSNSPRDNGHPEKYYMSLSRTFMKSRLFGDITFLCKGEELMKIPKKKIYHYNFNNTVPMDYKKDKDSRFHTAKNKRGITSGSDIEDEERITNNSGTISSFNKYIQKVIISKQLKKRNPQELDDFIKLLDKKNITWEFIDGFNNKSARTSRYKSIRNKR